MAEEKYQEGDIVKVPGQYTDFEYYVVSQYGNGELGLAGAEEYLHDLKDNAVELIGNVYGFLKLLKFKSKVLCDIKGV